MGPAFPTLGAAAAAEIAADRFGAASAFRQFGAVIGTAILIAIVGDPTRLAEALEVSDRAYLFAVGGALGAGAVPALIVTRRVTAAPVVPAAPG